MKAVIYINGKAKFTLTLYKKYTISDLKSMLSENLDSLVKEYRVRFFINSKSELEVFDNDEYDNLKLESVWDKLVEPKIYIKGLNLDNSETRNIISKSNTKSNSNVKSKLDTLTGIKDTDRLILERLPDKELVYTCNLNTILAQKVCDDNFWRRIVGTRYPETIQYKDYKIRTWKDHFINIIKYKNKLNRIGKPYTSNKGSPELYYLLVHKLAIKNYYLALLNAIQDGNLALIKYIYFQNLINQKILYNVALVKAVQSGNLSALQFLVEHGLDVNIDNNVLLYIASFNINKKYGFEIVQLLVENGANLNDPIRPSLIMAVMKEYLPLIRYLFEHGAQFTRVIFDIMLRQNVNLNIYKYFIDNGVNIKAYIDNAMLDPDIDQDLLIKLKKDLHL